MSGAMTPGRDETFQERLKRIEGARVPVGEALESFDGDDLPDRTEISPLPDLRETLRRPLQLIATLCVGLALVFLIRLARFHIMGGSLTGGEGATLTMLLDVGVAVAIGILFIKLMRFEGPVFKAVQIAGVLVMAVFMHNFVHSAPKIFSLAFSAEWTDEVIAGTEPASILIRGVSIPLVPEKEEEKKMPTVRRL